MKVLGEALVVAVAGLLVGLAGNALLPDGLDLGRDHFPSGLHGGPTPGASASLGDILDPDTAPPPALPAVRDDDVDPAVVARLAEAGLVALGHADTVDLWKDPAREFGAYVFVDARDEERFDEGHVPGALLFDHYRPGRTAGAVAPVVTDPATLLVIVYCNGGQCEDSEFAARDLMQLGVPPERLRVYVGGMEAWRAAGLPVEQGGG